MWKTFKFILPCMASAMVLTTLAVGIDNSTPGHSQIRPQASLASPGAQANAWGLLDGFRLIATKNPKALGWRSNCQLIPENCNSPKSLFHSVINTTNGSISPTKSMLGPNGGSQTTQLDTTSLTVNGPDYSVWYSKDAAKYLDGVLKGIANPKELTPKPGVDPISFPEDSVIVIPGWEVLSAASSRIVQMNIYDPTKPASSTIPERAIDTKNPTCTNELKKTDPIPIGCFYSVHPGADYDFYRLESSSVGPEDIFVLVAFHIIKKQHGKWTWSTFWWQAENQDPKFVRYPCASATGANCQDGTGQWGHYAMDIVELPPGNDTPILPVFNPYLDVKFQNGSQTNCVVCHSFAASPMKFDANVSSNYGARIQTDLNKLRQSLRTYLANKKCTDMVWTVDGALDHRAPPSNVSVVSPSPQPSSSCPILKQ